MSRSSENLSKDLAGYQRLADLVGVLSSPIRLELIEALAQCARTVEVLSSVCALPVKTVSHHLQKLLAAGLVRRTARGREAEYSLSDASVVGLWAHLQAFAEEQAARRESSEGTAPEHSALQIGAGALWSLVDEGRAALLDVRPAAEYSSGHIPGAQSIPLQNLEHQLDELPQGRLIVAVCRGPYCRLADAAVSLLQSRGFEAVRYSGGVLKWRADGGEISREDTDENSD